MSGSTKSCFFNCGENIFETNGPSPVFLFQWYKEYLAGNQKHFFHIVSRSP